MTSSSTTTVTVHRGTAHAGVEPAPEPTHTNPAKIDGYSYLGCFASSSDFCTFEQVHDGEDTTLDKCVELCAGRTYVGIRAGECLCADDLDPNTRAAPGEDQCSLPCPGRACEICGGEQGSLTVYADVRGEERPQPPPMAAAAVITVTTCPPPDSSSGTPVRTGLPIGTGVVPTPSAGGGDVPDSRLTPGSGAVERRGPSKMSVVVGVVVMGVMLVM
jgi:hypothetical protein